MVSFIIRRLILALFTTIAVSFVAFVVTQLPAGDYVDYLAENCPIMDCHLGTGIEDFSTRGGRDLARERLGLNDPFIVQYWNWIYPIAFTFDFGMSSRPGGVWQSANVMLMEVTPPTIYLTFFTILITWSLAIPIGIYSAVRQHSVGDYVFTFLGFTGLAVPDFLLALVVMYLLFAYFEVSVGALHSSTYELAPWSIGKVIDMLQHLLIPAAVLGTAGTAALIRIMRNNLLDELSRPYVVTAQAKGLSTWKLVIKYPVRLAINPFVSGIGFILPTLISGSVILSVVMGLPTLGLLLYGAIKGQNVWLAADVILILGILTVIGTLISDLLLMVVDPRIKLSGNET